MNKVVASAEEAIRDMRDNMTIMVGGWTVGVDGLGIWSVSDGAGVCLGLGVEYDQRASRFGAVQCDGGGYGYFGGLRA